MTSVFSETKPSEEGRLTLFVDDHSEKTEQLKLDSSHVCVNVAEHHVEQSTLQHQRLVGR